MEVLLVELHSIPFLVYYNYLIVLCLVLLQVIKHWCRLFKRSCFRNHTATESIIPSSQDPYGDLLKWLLPLKNSIPSPSPSLTPSPQMNSSSIRSSSKNVNPSATSASPIFSFGHFRSYSMSAIPPSDVPVLPSSSMSSIDLEDQNQFSSRKSMDEKGEAEGLLSFRGVPLEII
uniref:Uncharacterized protein n=1 Tax=Lactuca sativa TaxID=4236 RepID=A0A9R1VIS9_LACSA|nr:hypothetical protein LSAT_V11C500250690 [Lactuca sativa]